MGCKEPLSAIRTLAKWTGSDDFELMASRLNICSELSRECTGSVAYMCGDPILIICSECNYRVYIDITVPAALPCSEILHPTSHIAARHVECWDPRIHNPFFMKV